MCASLLVLAATAGRAQDALLVARVPRRGAPELIRFSAPSAPPETGPLDPELKTPLGSLWKLFVYSYLSENRKNAPPFACAGASPEEAFCCRPGGSIGMDDALVRSCGLFFDPRRLGIDARDWTAFWRGKMGLPYPWLNDLGGLGPQRQIPVRELLSALGSLEERGSGFSGLSGLLARVVIDGTARGAVRTLGALYRVKTFTWDDPEEKGRMIGGFAGWLIDGSPVWVRGRGTSAQVASQWAQPLALLAGRPGPGTPKPCVEVGFFDRYSIREIRALPSGLAPGDGPLSGRHRIFFENGSQADFESSGEIRLSRAGGRRALSGRFDVDEYVARVIDREISPEPAQAAKALAVAIRTYLYQNARMREGCYRIADSTRLQRVAINPSSPKAREIAAWSGGLILQGVPALRYHRWKSGPGLLSWEQARSLAGQGYYFDQILKTAYPEGRIAVADAKGAAACRRSASAESWLKGRSRDWSRALAGLPGYQAPASVQVCELDGSAPYSDIRRDRIFMRFSFESEDQITAAHEYLHLAFKNHPRGLDEDFIELQAKELVQRDGVEYGRN